jgi:hypothetical protein
MFEKPLSAEQVDAEDVYQAIELYYERGWTDGLPVVPPTEKRVRAFLDAVGLEPDHVVGEIPERDRIITAELLAINAVMAGCLPEYMPVLVAAVEAITDPAYKFNQRYRIGEVLFREKPFLGNIAPEPILAEMAARARVVITGVGD